MNSILGSPAVMNERQDYFIKMSNSLLYCGIIQINSAFEENLPFVHIGSSFRCFFSNICGLFCVGEQNLHSIPLCASEVQIKAT